MRVRRAATLRRRETLAAASHLSGVFIFVGPALLYWLGGRRDPTVARESREALFAQLHFGSLTACLLGLAVIFTPVPLGQVCMVLGAFVHAASLFAAVDGGVRAALTGTHRYPLLG